MSGTSSSEKRFERLRTVAEQAGVDVIASTRIDEHLRKTFHGAIVEISVGLDSAVVIGIRLSGPVLETVERAPTWTYYHHYRMVNIALDQAALRIARPREQQLSIFRGEWLRHLVVRAEDPPREDRGRLTYLRKLFMQLDQHEGIDEIQEFRQTAMRSMAAEGGKKQ